jgi:hypothetical protein
VTEALWQHLLPRARHDAALSILDSLALGDRGYWSPQLRGELLRHGVALLAPFQTAKYEKTPWPHWLVLKRRRIETVLAQLVERYRA